VFEQREKVKQKDTNLEMRPLPTERRIERLLVVSNGFGRDVGKDDVKESFVGFSLLVSQRKRERSRKGRK